MKKIILLTTFILIVALTLCACTVTPEPPHEHTYESGWTSSPTHHWHAATCEHTTDVRGMAPHTFSGNKCTVCGYQTEVKPNPTPTPSRPAEEVIAEYLVSLGDNFTVSATLTTVSTNIPIRTEERKYKALLDGNKIYAEKDEERYYVEQTDGSVYLYTQDNEQWHKELATVNELNLPTNIEAQLKEILTNVEWQDYDEENGVANGVVEINNYKFGVEVTLNDDNAKILLISLPIPIITIDIKIYNIGTTTVTLPADYIDDTVAD